MQYLHIGSDDEHYELQIQGGIVCSAWKLTTETWPSTFFFFGGGVQTPRLVIRPFFLTLPGLVTPHRPVLCRSVHWKSAFSTAWDLSWLSYSSIGVCNSLSEFCVQHCFKYFANQWLEISWFSHTARVSLRCAIAFGKQVLGEWK